MEPIKNLKEATNAELKAEAEYLEGLYKRTQEIIKTKLDVLGQAADRYTDIAKILEERGEPLINEKGEPVLMQDMDEINREAEEEYNGGNRYSAENPYSGENLEGPRP